MRWKDSISLCSVFSLCLTFGLGCATEDGPEREDDRVDAVDSVDSPEAVAPTLEITELSEDRLTGSAQVDDTHVEFDVRQTEHQVFAIEIRYGDHTLTAESDYINSEYQLDGFKSDGSDLELGKRDVVLIEQVGRTIASSGLPKAYRPDVRQLRGVVYQTPSSALKRALAVWAGRAPGSTAERNIKLAGITYLCGYLTSWYVPASHDCWDCSLDDGWNLVNIGPGGPVNCYPDSCSPLCSNYNNGDCAALSCEQPGGGVNVVQWGSNWDKYGACTTWDTNAYTVDCLQHDHCTRNDHSTGSFWCMDESNVAADDQTQATDCIMNNGCSGNCGGYSDSGKCFCDASCDRYGDCCMDYHISCDV